MFSNYSKKILLICDQRWRDLPTVCLLSQALKKHDLKNIIVNSREAKHLIPFYQPQVVVLNNIYSKELQNLAKVLKSNNILTVVLPTEGRGEPSLEKLNSSIFLNLKFVDLYFTWNIRNKNDLKKNNNKVKIFPLGCLRYDLFHNSFKKFIKPKHLTMSKYNLNSNFKTILWTTKFGYAKVFESSEFEKKKFYNQMIDNNVALCYEEDGKNWKKIPENHFKTRIKHADLMFKLIKSMPNVNFLIKPHPTEDKDFYVDRIKNNDLKNCKICKEEFIFDILQITDLLIQQKCTTALEGWALNIPVIDLSVSEYPQFDWPEYSLGNECVSSFEKLFKKVNVMLNNDYKVSLNKLKVREYWIKEFTNKIDGLMSKKAAKEISDLLSKNTANQKIILPNELKLKYFDCLRMSLKYFLSLNSKDSIVNFFKEFFFRNRIINTTKEVVRLDVNKFLNRLNSVYED